MPTQHAKACATSSSGGYGWRLQVGFSRFQKTIESRRLARIEDRCADSQGSRSQAALIACACLVGRFRIRLKNRNAEAVFADPRHQVGWSSEAAQLIGYLDQGQVSGLIA